MLRPIQITIESRPADKLAACGYGVNSPHPRENIQNGESDADKSSFSPGNKPISARNFHHLNIVGGESGKRRKSL